MEWVPLSMVCSHLVIGILCASVAFGAKQKAEPWFLAGALLGGLALACVLLLFSRKRPVKLRKIYPSISAQITGE